MVWKDAVANAALKLLAGLKQDRLGIGGHICPLIGNGGVGLKNYHSNELGRVIAEHSEAEPAISGFVGEGMVDISVVGDVFAAPGPQACVDAIRMADKGKGVLYLKEKNIEIVANYVGELLTVQEQGGFQMFMARIDDELLHYWNAPCNTPYLKK